MKFSTRRWRQRREGGRGSAGGTWIDRGRLNRKRPSLVASRSQPNVRPQITATLRASWEAEGKRSDGQRRLTAWPTTGRTTGHTDWYLYWPSLALHSMSPCCSCTHTTVAYRNYQLGSANFALAPPRHVTTGALSVDGDVVFHTIKTKLDRYPLTTCWQRPVNQCQTSNANFQTSSRAPLQGTDTWHFNSMIAEPLTVCSRSFVATHSTALFAYCSWQQTSYQSYKHNWPTTRPRRVTSLCFLLGEIREN